MTMEQSFVALKHYAHKVGINYWHVEFATKYRYKMFGKFKQYSLQRQKTNVEGKTHQTTPKGTLINFFYVFFVKIVNLI